jgi:hypothetical protein
VYSNTDLTSPPRHAPRRRPPRAGGLNINLKNWRFVIFY